MEEGQVHYRVEGCQAVLTIDRPQARNALSLPSIRELMAGIVRADAEPAARVMVITGAGERVFCSGGDLSGMTRQEGMLDAHRQRQDYARLLLAIQSARKPSIARVNGHALAGGFGLALACDLAVASQSAQFGTPEIDVGLFPMMAMALLERHVGRKHALELVMTGDRISAQRALELGLVNQVVPAVELDGAVGALAAKLAKKSQATLSLGRQAFFTSEDMPLDSALEFLSSQLSLNLMLEDAAEGVSAFLEKRNPQWKDR